MLSHADSGYRVRVNPPRVTLSSPFLGQPFSVGEAVAAGVTRGRLRGSDLQAPFRGIRAPATTSLDTLEARARAFAPRLRPGQVFAGATAAALWGLPIPWSVRRRTGVVVMVPTGTSRPTGRGVTAISVDPKRWQTSHVHGIAVASPALTLLTLSRTLAVHDLAAVADALRSTSPHYEGLEHVDAGLRPLLTPDELETLRESAPRASGIVALREAIDFARDRVMSPRETMLRWALVKIGGLPEPDINRDVRHDGRKIGTPDASYPSAKLAIEYEGDRHRTDRARWRGDITRAERFIEAGWRYMRVTDSDLFPSPREFIARVDGHLRAHG